jgi:hypothetical protein
MLEHMQDKRCLHTWHIESQSAPRTSRLVHHHEIKSTIFKYWCQYARKLEHFINTFLPPQCSSQNDTEPSYHVPQHWFLLPSLHNGQTTIFLHLLSTNLLLYHIFGNFKHFIREYRCFPYNPHIYVTRMWISSAAS